MIATAPSKPNIELSINQSLERDVCVCARAYFYYLSISQQVRMYLKQFHYTEKQYKELATNFILNIVFSLRI